MNILQSIAVVAAFFVAVFLLLFIPSLVQAGDPHHTTETINHYSIDNVINTNGQAALFAADQIHPSKNISGIQLGFGIAQHKTKVGFAAGAAFNVRGWGMLNGSVAKEPDGESFVGLGINLSLKR